MPPPVTTWKRNPIGDGTQLEPERARNGLGGSNPSASAMSRSRRGTRPIASEAKVCSSTLHGSTAGMHQRKVAGLITQCYLVDQVQFLGPQPMPVQQRRERSALGQRARTAAARAELLKVLGGACKRCGFSDVRALCVDHVNGGGHRESKKLGANIYRVALRRIRGGSSDYQLLCGNCNMIKKHERRESPPRKYEGEYVLKPLRPCGTHSAYKRGCRCTACVEAHRIYCRARMRVFRSNKNLAL